MKYQRVSLQLGFTLAFVAAVTRAADPKGKRQIGVASATITEEDDRDTAETGFSDAVQSGSKYFQYAHVPAKDHYEFGHRRGNEHHFNERHEKAHPHAGDFKTKVRWGDKHGGYGEHYWDYNHAGHGHDGEGEGSNKEEEYAAYDGTEQVPAYTPRKQRHALIENGDVEFINERARSLAEDAGTGRHGGNYRREPGSESPKRKREDVYNSETLFNKHSNKFANQRFEKFH